MLLKSNKDLENFILNTDNYINPQCIIKKVAQVTKNQYIALTVNQIQL